MDEAKIKEVFSDEAFVNSLMELENVEDVQKALSEKGLDFSSEEIEAIRKRLAGEDEELGENDLENVAGGVAIATVAAVVGIIAGVAGLAEMVGSSIRRHRW